MEKPIKNILQNYKDCTSNIIEILKKEDFDSLDDEIKKRENILDEIISAKENKIEAQKLYEELKISDLEKKLESLMKEKMTIIKHKLESISKNKKASNAYGGLGKGFAVMFSKKI